MKSRLYRSRVSLGAVALIAIALLALVGSLRQTWQDGTTIEIAAATAFTVPLVVLLLWLFDTRYWIEASVLHVRFLMIHWRIPVDSIVRITFADTAAGRKAGLSLDMIEVWHRRGSVAISPRHRGAFLAELRRAREALGLQPIRGVSA